MKNSIIQKILLTWLLATTFSVLSFSQSVTVSEAERAATHFLQQQAGGNEKRQVFGALDTYVKTDGSDTLYYVVNMEPEGYVFVSADKKALPVFGYSTTGLYEPDMDNPEMNAFMERNCRQLKFARNNKARKDNLHSKSWEDLLSGKTPASPKSMSMQVDPLLSTTWNQGNFYNNWCPSDANSTANNGHVWAGCVATAMGQIMRYHEYPNFGTGSHSYTHGTYGLQSADFSAGYNWSQMPNSLSSPNAEVARLLYHCGVSVDMNYAPDGSGANGAEHALNNYFGYDGAFGILLINGEGIVINELINNRPIIYIAFDGFFGQNAGHAWVCDGFYTNAQGVNYFHMNWGWGGAAHGCFVLSNLTPDLSGPEPDPVFGNWHSAITHIVPKYCHQSYHYPGAFPIVASTEAANEITISAPMLILGSVLYDAGTYVQMNPGTLIDAHAGGVFSTKIEGCGGLAGGNFTSGGNSEVVEERSQDDPGNPPAPANPALKIAPNPASGEVTISFSTEKEEPVSLELFTLTGQSMKILLKNAQVEAGAQKVKMDISDLPPGIYLLRLQLGQAVKTEKLVVSDR